MTTESSFLKSLMTIKTLDLKGEKDEINVLHVKLVTPEIVRCPTRTPSIHEYPIESTT